MKMVNSMSVVEITSNMGLAKRELREILKLDIYDEIDFIAEELRISRYQVIEEIKLIINSKLKLKEMIAIS